MMELVACSHMISWRGDCSYQYLNNYLAFQNTINILEQLQHAETLKGKESLPYVEYRKCRPAWDGSFSKLSTAEYTYYQRLHNDF